LVSDADEVLHLDPWSMALMRQQPSAEGSLSGLGFFSIFASVQPCCCCATSQLLKKAARGQ